MLTTNLWKRAPFARIVLPFIAGIGAQLALETWNIYVGVIGVSLFLALVFLTFSRKTVFKYRLRFATGGLVFGLFFILGFSHTHFSFDKYKQSYFGHHTSNTVRLRILDAPKETNTFWKARAEVLQVFDSISHSASGKLIVYLAKTQDRPQYGDIIDVNNKPIEVRPVKNPGEFNYKRFLKYKGVEYQLFARDGRWAAIGENKVNPIWNLGVWASTWLERIIDTHLTIPEHRAVVKALLLGNKSELSPELIQGFSHTGTMHILAVSGLHVGSIILLLGAFLSALRIPKRHVFRLLFMLFGLWSFALITGFSASVSRAAFMFSIWKIADHFERGANVYNTLAFSAFVLLVINPFNVMDVGFQFSYLAVFGIVFLSRDIRNWFNTRYWLVDQLLTLMAVSLAAQIATFPFSLYYFHQIPTLFLVSNVVVIPIITVVLYLSVLLMVLAKVPIIVTGIVYLIDAYLWFIRKAVSVIESIPFAYFLGVHISIVELCCFVLLVGAMVLFFKNRRTVSLFISLGTMICILGLQIHRNNVLNKSRELVFFDLAKSSGVAYRNGSAIHWIGPELPSKSDWAYHCQPYFMQLGIHNASAISLLSDSMVEEVKVSGLKLFYLNDRSKANFKSETDSSYDLIYVQSRGGYNWDLLKTRSKYTYLSNESKLMQSKRFDYWLDEHQEGAEMLEGFVSIPLESE